MLCTRSLRDGEAGGAERPPARCARRKEAAEDEEEAEAVVQHGEEGSASKEQSFKDAPLWGGRAFFTKNGNIALALLGTGAPAMLHKIKVVVVIY